MNSAKRTLFLALLSVIAGFLRSPAHAALVPVVQERGNLSVSADAEGNNNSWGGSIRVQKPANATVRKAYLMASSNYSRLILDGDIVLAGTPVAWDTATVNDVPEAEQFFHNVFADVTGTLKPIVDAAPAGIVNLGVLEWETDTVDGTALIVLFDDPSQPDRSVILLFGAQRTDGEEFVIELTEPLDLEAPGAEATMALGISYGYQGLYGTDQVSWIDVNGIPLTSSAGGEDDGGSFDGGLITIGGIGDSTGNPPPLSGASWYRTDDELYNLLPFVDSGDTSILVNTYNPSDDDNIFAAYLVTNGSAGILPPVDPPQGRVLLGNLDPELPTIVLTHGLQDRGSDCDSNADCETSEACRFGLCTRLWLGNGGREAGSLIESALGEAAADVNVVQYIWEEAFTADGLLPTGEEYKKAQGAVVDAGNRLASQLLNALGLGYDRPMHFIGHSLGTAVNARAAAAFLATALDVEKVQFTALDRPHHIRHRVLCNPNCGIPGLTAQEEALFGYDSDFFATALPISRPGLDLRIDNYFSLDGAGVGDVADGSTTYNHEELVNPNDLDDLLFEDEGADNNHSGVHQWYRWTVSPNDLYDSFTVCHSNSGELLNLPLFLDSSINPCRRGWWWSINNLAASLPWDDRFPEPNGAPLSMSVMETAGLDQQQEFGCEFLVDGPTTTIVCTEASSPFAAARIQIPEDATFLTFEYRFGNEEDGDYAAVVLDEMPVWVLSASSAPATGTFLDSGLIPLGELSGETSLTVALYGVGLSNAHFEARNFRFVAIQPTCGNAEIDPEEECDDGDPEYAAGDSCGTGCRLVPCGQPVSPEGAGPKAGDALFVLRSAVGQSACALRVCDVNGSGGVSSVDALIVLRRAVGLDVFLACPS